MKAKKKSKQFGKYLVVKPDKPNLRQFRKTKIQHVINPDTGEAVDRTRICSFCHTNKIWGIYTLSDLLCSECLAKHQEAKQEEDEWDVSLWMTWYGDQESEEEQPDKWDELCVSPPADECIDEIDERVAEWSRMVKCKTSGYNAVCHTDYL